MNKAFRGFMETADLYTFKRLVSITNIYAPRYQHCYSVVGECMDRFFFSLNGGGVGVVGKSDQLYRTYLALIN